MISRWLDRAWFVPAPALRLATLRVLIVGFAWLYLFVRLPAVLVLHEHPAGQFHPVGLLLGWTAPPPVAVVIVAVLAAIASGLAFGLGFRARVSGPVFAILLTAVLSYRNAWGMVFHTENLLVLHVIVLACSRSSDALALDARARPVPDPHARYGWPLRLMAAITVLTYVVAGVAKLRHAGLSWITSDALLTFVAYDNVRKAELGSSHTLLGSVLPHAPAWWSPFAAFALVIELGAPLALVHPRLARVWALAAWSFHVGVLAVMVIAFPYPLSGLAYACFFQVERLARGPAWRGVARWRERWDGAR